MIAHSKELDELSRKIPKLALDLNSQPKYRLLNIEHQILTGHNFVQTHPIILILVSFDSARRALSNEPSFVITSGSQVKILGISERYRSKIFSREAKFS